MLRCEGGRARVVTLGFSPDDESSLFEPTEELDVLSWLGIDEFEVARVTRVRCEMSLSSAERGLAV